MLLAQYTVDVFVWHAGVNLLQLLPIPGFTYSCLCYELPPVSTKFKVVWTVTFSVFWNTETGEGCGVDTELEPSAFLTPGRMDKSTVVSLMWPWCGTDMIRLTGVECFRKTESSSNIFFPPTQSSSHSDSAGSSSSPTFSEETSLQFDPYTLAWASHSPTLHTPKALTKNFDITS